MVRASGLQSGKEIGILEVLRYSKDKLSKPKWREFADDYKFEELDSKYPENELCQKTN